MTVRRKMIALIVLPTLTIYVAVLGLTAVHLQNASREEVEQSMSRLTASYAARFNGAFREAAAIADATAHFVETEPDLTGPQLFAQLRANVNQNPHVYGAAMAFEPGSYKTDESLFCPYVYRGADGLEQMNISRDVYDWYSDERWQWWHIPKRTGRGAWTDPYFDEGAGNVLMTTYSAPFFAGDQFRGVTTVDIMLPTLHESIGREILTVPDFVILTSRGQYVYSPKPELIMNRTVFDFAKEHNRADLAEVAELILSGTAGVATVDGWDTPDTQCIFYAPIASTGWAFAVRLPQREILAAVNERMVFASLALAFTLVLIIGCVWYVSGRITRPIGRLRSKALEIAGGNLDARVEGITSRDEIGELAQSFNTMTAELRSHVDRLASERASREKLERDLDLAREIQRGLLPLGKPDVPGYEIAGWSQPADQTGGDYYDWQPLPDGRLAVSLADVTGHGIGPALVTAVCRAYARASFPSPEELGTLVNRINELLVEDLTSGRFVTFVVACLDSAAHQIELLSAGHGPLFLYTAADGQVREFKAHDIPFGIAPDVGYGPPQVIDLAPGDLLVLITDGFFEWSNSTGEQFGTKRLGETIRAASDLSPDEMISRVYAAVREFVGDTAQDDDLTAVVLKRSAAPSAS